MMVPIGYDQNGFYTAQRQGVDSVLACPAKVDWVFHITSIIIISHLEKKPVAYHIFNWHLSCL